MKTSCMPNVQRVYCDMDMKGNFYLYHGNYKSPTSLGVDKKDL